MPLFHSYGYPLDDATRTALDEVRKFLAGPSGSSISTVIFTVFRPIDVDSCSSCSTLQFLPVLTAPRPPTDTEYLPEFFPPPPAPTNLPVPASAPDPTHRPGPSPVGGAGVPPSAGADSDELAHADSVKEGAETTATAMSVDGERSQLVGVPKELASVKIGSVKEDESVETVVGDLPEKEAQEELV